jgi:hypothetical protein
VTSKLLGFDYGSFSLARERAKEHEFFFIIIIKFLKNIIIIEEKL